MAADFQLDGKPIRQHHSYGSRAAAESYGYGGNLEIGSITIIAEMRG